MNNHNCPLHLRRVIPTLGILTLLSISFQFLKCKIKIALENLGKTDVQFVIYNKCKKLLVLLVLPHFRFFVFMLSLSLTNIRIHLLIPKLVSKQKMRSEVKSFKHTYYSLCTQHIH
jgi:hypothetical protein